MLSRRHEPGVCLGLSLHGVKLVAGGDERVAGRVVDRQGEHELAAVGDERDRESESVASRNGLRVGPFLCRLDIRSLL